MSCQNRDPQGEEPNHPVPSCQAPTIAPCDHVVPDVLLRSSPQVNREDTLAYEHDHFILVSQTYELEIQANQLALAHKQKQSQSDIFPAQADVSYTNPDSLPYPSVDCIPECRDTPVPDGILQRQILPWPKPKPWLSKKDVPPWPNILRPQPKPRLSLKRASKVPTSPDVCHQDLPVPDIACEDIYCASKCTPTLSDSDLGVSDEVETCIPSPIASPDLNDVTTYSSEVS